MLMLCETMQMYMLSGRFRAVDILREDLWPRIGTLNFK